MLITFCGVRGSTPAPGAPYLRYGGNTSCVAVAQGPGEAPVLALDAGTGVANLNELLGGAAFTGTILLTHLHWDHCLGLPFFRGGDREDARVTLLLPEQGDGPASDAAAGGAERLLAQVMSPPFFPIRPAQLRGNWEFDAIAPGQLKAEGFTVEAREIPHKGGRTLGYRVSDGRASIAYVTDHCPTSLGPGPDGLGAYHEAAVELARGADLLIHDAQLTAEEVPAEAAWGHAAAEYAVGLAVCAGARRVALTHHKPSRTDDQLDALAGRFAGAPVPVLVAAEGLSIEL
ncbi:MBL fold metallo-hydrolase [Trebonia kvetii]|uniref:MBL fold metallo-hydrolase n=1 Tax=Trebonia kvetii TaxID=2480626 RepID=A0A6P2C5U7_9ACTN|nr:MBL fold metallo-hydrolase [Trebonia kvetii]TVZ05491.1 MBL fold metallo-hydrolase [Trebonia kvetii]